MTLTAALFGYAAVLAVAIPRLLGGRWLDRSPRLALTLWHTSAVSALSAATLATVACFADGGMLRVWLAALTDGKGGSDMLIAGATLVVPALVVGRVGFAAVRLLRIRRSEQRRHLELLSLLGRHDSELDATILPADVPAAYCVPGARQIVLTSGAVTVLDDVELRAVLTHERAHLAGRHHLLVAWADVLRHAFGALPLFGRIREVTGNLVELLADDQAVRRVSGDSLATAIAALSCGRAPAVGLAASGGSVAARVERLMTPPEPLPVATRIGGAGAVLSLMTMPFLVIIVPTLFAASLVACPHLF
ncbi:M56 family metallopeptidase [Kribbella sp. NPDC000426]|uniref:M56 family metallopeptidase n=1 Tax=Kribbella sp. NPDC000426 TaxID=3154255 RepID=UPI00331F943D